MSEPTRFQSTLPHGERRSCGNSTEGSTSFNPRSHMGSDADDVTDGVNAWKFQSSSHMGSDVTYTSRRLSHEVSIHAPTWGATRNRRITEGDPLRFNPRSHMGSDTDTGAKSHVTEVSIHAPTWGATLVIDAITEAELFQSTLPHGERPHSPTSRPSSTSFNPRSHMGSDRNRRITEGNPLCFNPRSHMGSDELRQFCSLA